MTQRKLSIWLSVIYLLAVVSVILFKFPFKFSNLDHIRRIELIPFFGTPITNEAGFFNNILYNVLFFIPFGIFVCLIKPDWKFSRKVIPIVILSLSFETIQYVFSIGVSDITDLITNTAGGMMGIGIFHLMRAMFKENTHKTINTIGLALVAVMLFLFFAALLFLRR